MKADHFMINRKLIFSKFFAY